MSVVGVSEVTGVNVIGISVDVDVDMDALVVGCVTGSLMYNRLSSLIMPGGYIRAVSYFRVLILEGFRHTIHSE